MRIGLDPAFIDFTTMPQFSPEMFRSFIDAQVERVRGLGYEVTSCLVDLGDTAEAVTKVLNETGELQAWQYETKAGVSGVLEEAPVRKIAVSAGPATRIESYRTSLNIRPITDEIMIEAIR